MASGRLLQFAWLSIAAAVWMIPTAAAQDLGNCGSLENGYGPFDYRIATPAQKHIVESYHFTQPVQTLQHGINSTLGGDIDYTLRAFPNHRQALLAMIRLGKRDKTAQPKGAQWTIDCYLERAIRFQPDDAGVRELRGIYYSMQHKYKDAIADFKEALETAPNNANAHYNLGLAYFEVGDYAGAREEALVAKKLGFPLQGLENMLKVKKQWAE